MRRCYLTWIPELPRGRWGLFRIRGMDCCRWEEVERPRNCHTPRVSNSSVWEDESWKEAGQDEDNACWQRCESKGYFKSLCPLSSSPGCQIFCFWRVFISHLPIQKFWQWIKILKTLYGQNKILRAKVVLCLGLLPLLHVNLFRELKLVISGLHSQEVLTWDRWDEALFSQFLTSVPSMRFFCHCF